MYQEIFAGLGETAESIWLSLENHWTQYGGGEGIFSFHAWAPLPLRAGKVHIAYVPNGRVAGFLVRWLRTCGVPQETAIQENDWLVEIVEAWCTI